jgi:hypothetical protein
VANIQRALILLLFNTFWEKVCQKPAVEKSMSKVVAVEKNMSKNPPLRKQIEQYILKISLKYFVLKYVKTNYIFNIGHLMFYILDI